MSTRLLAGLASGVVLIIATACGGTGGGASSAPTGRAPSAAATGAAATAGSACSTDATEGEAVAIADFEYDPAELTVAVGTTVAWTNSDSAPHTVTFTDGVDCGRLAQGESTALDFDTAGTFPYICTIHPQMQGTIIVE